MSSFSCVTTGSILQRGVWQNCRVIARYSPNDHQNLLHTSILCQRDFARRVPALISGMESLTETEQFRHQHAHAASLSMPLLKSPTTAAPRRPRVHEVQPGIHQRHMRERLREIAQHSLQAWIELLC